MTIIFTLSFAPILIWVILVFWFMICNNRAYDQRGRILRGIKRASEVRAFDTVSYNQHLWCLFFFRKPPYPPGLCLNGERNTLHEVDPN